MTIPRELERARALREEVWQEAVPLLAKLSGMDEVLEAWEQSLTENENPSTEASQVEVEIPTLKSPPTAVARPNKEGSFAYWSPEDDEKLEAMKREGRTAGSIGRQLGRTKSAVDLRWHYLKKNGAAKDNDVPVGKANGVNKEINPPSHASCSQKEVATPSKPEEVGTTLAPLQSHGDDPAQGPLHHPPSQPEQHPAEAAPVAQEEPQEPEALEEPSDTPDTVRPSLWTPEMDDTLLIMRHQGQQFIDIAAKLGLRSIEEVAKRWDELKVLGIAKERPSSKPVDTDGMSGPARRRLLQEVLHKPSEKTVHGIPSNKEVQRAPRHGAIFDFSGDNMPEPRP